MGMTEQRKPTFRSPLRNEWERVRLQFVQMQGKPGRDGVIARMMVAFMPVLVEEMERERDRKTPPQDLFDALAAVCGQIIEEAIEKQPPVHPPHVCLQRMLTMINAVVAPRVTAARPSSLILPGDM